MSNDFLKDLLPGMRVVVQGPYPTSRQDLCPINKVTKTQIVIGDGLQARRFNRETGMGIGGYAYDRCSLRQATPELVDKLLRIQYVELLRNVELSRVTEIPTNTLIRCCCDLGLIK